MASASEGAPLCSSAEQSVCATRPLHGEWGATMDLRRNRCSVHESCSGSKGCHAAATARCVVEAWLVRGVLGALVETVALLFGGVEICGFCQLCFRAGIAGIAPVTRSSVEAPRGGGVFGGGSSESGVGAGSAEALEGLVASPGCPRVRQVLLEALQRLKRKDKKQYFAVAVDPKLVPDYESVVTNPMHFEAIREKAEKGLYQEFSEFDADVALIVSNCRLYNHPDTPFCRAAALVEACWDKFRERFRAKFDKPEEQIADKDASTEQQGDLVKGFEPAEEAIDVEGSWFRQRLVTSLLMRSTANPRAAAALGLLEPQSLNSQAPQDSAQDAHEATLRPLGIPLPGEGKDLNVLEYPLPPHPGARPAKRYSARHLSYNCSIMTFLGADTLQRLEASCPALRPSLRRLRQKEPPKAPLTDIRLFGVDTPDFSEFNSRLSGARISSSNSLSAAVFTQEQQQMRIRLLRAAAKAAAAAGGASQGPPQSAPGEGGPVPSSGARGPPVKRLKTDASEAEGASVGTFTKVVAASASGDATTKPPEEAPASGAALADATKVQQGDRATESAVVTAGSMRRLKKPTVWALRRFAARISRFPGGFPSCDE
ncbi:hypothetical protein cyc_01595 [Cyclospora cayetanensis]|uniref:Bromo domain-containing protein n=1 Tax=Cyclospora cayetanensis TaxID=88456 RepID=A0A1D3D945_9EIME|nr:hypothetical protein cyc_01595 [Cyclospora cayetanensis]